MDVEEVLDVLADRTTLPTDVVSDLADWLAYCLDEPDEALLEEVSARWLAGEDRRRAEIALLRADAFPAHDRDELERRLAAAVARHPGLRAPAAEVIARWDRQVSGPDREARAAPGRVPPAARPEKLGLRTLRQRLTPRLGTAGPASTPDGPDAPNTRTT